MITSKEKPVAVEAPALSPLRVCLVATASGEMTGGLASYLRCLADHLSQECAVSVVARFTRMGEAGKAVTMYAGAEPPRTLDHGRYQTRIIAPPAAWRPTLRRLISLVSRPALQPLALWLYRRAYQPSLAVAMPAPVDVVHYVGNGWELLGFAALAEARRRGAAFTVWPAVHPGTWGDSPLDVALYNQAEAVFVQSKSEQAHLARLGVNPSRLHRCGLAPATEANGDAARFRRKHGIEGRPLILFIGRKDRGKGYHALREAMPNILAAVPDVCLVTIGPDCEPPYPDVPERALLDLGRAEEAEKADALAACDVFCLPSEKEAFGIVYVEAWSYGKPVIGGSAPAVRDLITEGVNGYCVAQDKDAIAVALSRLLRDATLRERLGAEGCRVQQDRFTWSSVTESHRLVFRDALATVNRSRSEDVP